MKLNPKMYLNILLNNNRDTVIIFFYINTQYYKLKTNYKLQLVITKTFIINDSVLRLVV